MFIYAYIYIHTRFYVKIYIRCRSPLGALLLSKQTIANVGDLSGMSSFSSSPLPQNDHLPSVSSSFCSFWSLGLSGT